MDSNCKKRKVEENGAVETTGGAEEAVKMVEHLNREQLVDILREAATKHVDVLQQIRCTAEKDPSLRKLFVRGLGWDANTESLRALFSEFGELEEAVVIMDKKTGNSKGYGFVTYKHMDGAFKALKEPSKRIGGRMTVTQLASQQQQQQTDVSSRRIYVGNVPMDMGADRLLTLFSQYGEIEEGPLGFDKQSGRCRGFAMFIYKTVEATKHALQEPKKRLDGHEMLCKLAVERKKPTARWSDQMGQNLSNPLNEAAGIGVLPPHNHSLTLGAQPNPEAWSSPSALTQVQTMEAYAATGGPGAAAEWFSPGPYAPPPHPTALGGAPTAEWFSGYGVTPGPCAPPPQPTALGGAPTAEWFTGSGVSPGPYAPPPLPSALGGAPTAEWFSGSGVSPGPYAPPPLPSGLGGAPTAEWFSGGGIGPQSPYGIPACSRVAQSGSYIT